MKDSSCSHRLVPSPSRRAADPLAIRARPLRNAGFAAALGAMLACVSMVACTALPETPGAGPAAARAPKTTGSITGPAREASTAASKPALTSAAPEPAALARFVVEADGIPAALEGRAGDASRGKALLVEHEAANCVLCHAMPQLGLRFSGNLGPSLERVGAKLSRAQLRLRVVDSTRLDPAATMPSYYRIAGLDRVASPYRARPILDAQQVEDVIAYLAELK